MKSRERLMELTALILLAVFLLHIGVSYYIVMGIIILLIINYELDEHENLKELGITKKRIWPSIKIQMPVTLIGIMGLFLFAYHNGLSINFSDLDLAYILLSVPMQNFLFRAYVQSVLRSLLPTLGVVAVAALLFSVSHIFSENGEMLILIGTTFFAGFAWSFAYEKERNLVGPIVSHMILGTFLFMII